MLRLLTTICPASKVSCDAIPYTASPFAVASTVTSWPFKLVYRNTCVRYAPPRHHPRNKHAVHNKRYAIMRYRAAKNTAGNVSHASTLTRVAGQKYPTAAPAPKHRQSIVIIVLRAFKKRESCVFTRGLYQRFPKKQTFLDHCSFIASSYQTGSTLILVFESPVIAIEAGLASLVSSYPFGGFCILPQRSVSSFVALAGNDTPSPASRA